MSDELIEEWQLRVDGPALSGACAMVIPVRTAEGRAGVLKLTWPHWEAETEHLALRVWTPPSNVVLAAVEREVIADLNPPLNLTHTGPRPLLKAARKAMVGAALSQDSSTISQSVPS